MNKIMATKESLVRPHSKARTPTIPMPEKTDIKDAVLCLIITVSLVHVRLGNIRLITNPYKEIYNENTTTIRSKTRTLIKGSPIVMPRTTEAINIGARTVKLTSIFAANIKSIETGRLF